MIQSTVATSLATVVAQMLASEGGAAPQVLEGARIFPEILIFLRQGMPNLDFAIPAECPSANQGLHFQYMVPVMGLSAQLGAICVGLPIIRSKRDYAIIVRLRRRQFTQEATHRRRLKMKCARFGASSIARS